MWSKLRRLYKNSRPLLKNIVGFGSLFIGAEWTQQTLLKKVWKHDKNPQYDHGALARYTVFGVAWYPVIYHYWYRWLDRRFIGISMAVITKKALIDQFIMEPPLLATFYIGMSVMEGKEDIFSECKDKFLPTFMTGCVFWLPAMAINFRLLPTSWRVLFTGACTFIWCNFLCWFKRQEYISSK